MVTGIEKFVISRFDSMDNFVGYAVGETVPCDKMALQHAKLYSSVMDANQEISQLGWKKSDYKVERVVVRLIERC